MGRDSLINIADLVNRFYLSPDPNVRRAARDQIMLSVKGLADLGSGDLYASDKE